MDLILKIEFYRKRAENGNEKWGISELCEVLSDKAINFCIYLHLFIIYLSVIISSTSGRRQTASNSRGGEVQKSQNYWYRCVDIVLILQPYHRVFAQVNKWRQKGRSKTHIMELYLTLHSIWAAFGLKINKNSTADFVKFLTSWSYFSHLTHNNYNMRYNVARCKAIGHTNRHDTESDLN